MSEKRIHFKPPTSYKKLMYFDCFAVEKQSDFTILYFGNTTVRPIDVFACALTKQDIINSYKSSKDYIERLGSVEVGKDLNSLIGQCPIEVANVINMSKTEGIAEIELIGFAIHRLFSIRNGNVSSDNLESFGVALLRSSLSVHKQFIGSLYATIN